MSTKTKTKAEEAITVAVRYITVPDDVTIPSGIGYLRRVNGEEVDGGVMSFCEWYKRLVFPKMKRKTAAENETDSEAIRLFGSCKGKQRKEVTEATFAALVEALPDLSGNFELFLALRPFHVAVTNMPKEPPEGWKAG